MKILDRLTVLLKADAHGVLEQLEERSLLAKQHLREAELEINRKRVRCEALAEEARRMGEEALRLERECAALDEDVALALSGGKEELARFSIRRMLPKRRTVVELRERIELASEERDRLQSHLDSQEAEFELLEQRVRTLLATQRAGESLPEPAHVADEEVELELLRRRAGAEATR
jgi:phage shock protein A